MKTAAKISAGAAAFALAATLGAPTAAAEQSGANWLGTQADVADGGVVQGWTVSHLQRSTDTIPYAVQGQLWEATASDTSIQGDAVPIIGNFNARAADGQTYRVLWEVATPQGVNPSTLAQGATTQGKIYFDVNPAAPPDSVVYRGAEGPDLALWLTPPPTAGGSSSTWVAGTQGQVASGVPAAAAETPEAAQAGESLGVPLIEVGPAAPAAAPESLGVPVTTPSEATPAPLAAPGAPAPESSQGSAVAPTSQGVPLATPPAAGVATPPAAPSEEVIVVIPATP